MIWTEIYIDSIENLIKLFGFLPDVNFIIPEYVYNALAYLLRYATYFIPYNQLSPILITEFSLINFSLFISAYKGLRDFRK